MRYGVVILAGGKSKRMGTPKHRLQAGGLSFLDRLVYELGGFSELIVSVDDEKKHTDIRYPMVSDKTADCGPLGGLYAALTECTSDALVAVPCDVPYFSKNMAERLCAELDGTASAATDAVVSVTEDGRIHPLCGVYKKSCAAVFEECIGQRNYRMFGALERLRVKHFRVGKDSWRLYNVNTPEDFQKVQEDISMKLNFAIIGTSSIAESFLEAAATVEDFNLKGVYSRSMEKAEGFAKKYGAKLAFDSLDELAAHGGIDAVYIASPNCLHASQSIQMMQGGKHVLCEKTIASNLGEFERMRAASLENRVVLLEAMRSVFSPGFDVIRDSLPRLGTIRRVSFQFCQYSSRYGKFKNGIIENVFNPAFSGGALMDLGVYCVHPLVALFGMPHKVAGSSVRLSNGVDGAGTILVEYDGMQGELLYSKVTASRLPSQIQGEDGTMVIREIYNPLDVTIYGQDGHVDRLEIQGRENNISYEIEEFIRLVNEGRYDHHYLENSRMEMELMDEVRRQQGIVFPVDGI